MSRPSYREVDQEMARLGRPPYVTAFDKLPDDMKAVVIEHLDEYWTHLSREFHEHVRAHNRWWT